MNEDLISVIIPIYNAEKYLRQCLDSVLAQTYTNYEVIMVDDGSTDSSYNICLEYCNKDDRFKTFQKENGGASSARNLALKHARGEYYSFIDSDDWIENNALECLLQTAQKDKVDFVVYEASIIDETGAERKGAYSYHKHYGINLPYRMMREMIYHKEFHVSIPLMFFRKEFFKNNKICFYEGIMYEDMILAYQIYSIANKAVHLPKALYHRRYRKNSVVTTKKALHNFKSALTVYWEIVKFTGAISKEKQNYEHIIRCSFNALNDYKSLCHRDKQLCKKNYKELIKDIKRHNAFNDTALKYRCQGYIFWVVYKVFHKLFMEDKPDYHIYVNNFSDSLKKVMMLMPHMIGGGAERVAAQLMNQMYNEGVDTKFILSADSRENVIQSDLGNGTPLFLISEEMPAEPIINIIYHKLLRLLSSLICKPFELLKMRVPADFAKLSITSQYYREIKFINGLLRHEPDLSVIAFLQPTIPIALLAARGLPNKIIISERADPNRLMKKRYGEKFIKKYYIRANKVVFQTEDAKNAYPECIADKGVIISNPIKTNLPEPYNGKRNNNITTFCRISKQKNLPLLINAFYALHKGHKDYKLRIIGDAPNAEGIEVLNTINSMISKYNLDNYVIIEPFKADVHKSIISDAMYVNSSDYEGISNAMLEAMAIGLPTVCTDCPIGGANATIKDGENGLLVPIKDANALYMAMKRIIENETLSKKVSENASKLRESLSLEAIAKKWIDLLGD